MTSTLPDLQHSLERTALRMARCRDSAALDAVWSEVADEDRAVVGAALSRLWPTVVADLLERDPRPYAASWRRVLRDGDDPASATAAVLIDAAARGDGQTIATVWDGVESAGAPRPVVGALAALVRFVIALVDVDPDDYLARFATDHRAARPDLTDHHQQEDPQ